MKNQIIWLAVVVVFISACSPKMGELKKLNELENEKMAEVIIVRKNNFGMGAIHFYPTLNEEKIVGLNVEDYSRFYLKDGNYTFGLVAPDVVFGTWFKAKSIIKNIVATQKYYFLLSVGFASIQIDEILKDEAEKLISKGTRIPTATVSKTTNTLSTILKHMGNMMGLKEDTTQYKDVK